jgi:hypothetical protein
MMLIPFFCSKIAQIMFRSLYKKERIYSWFEIIFALHNKSTHVGELTLEKEHAYSSLCNKTP